MTKKELQALIENTENIIPEEADITLEELNLIYQVAAERKDSAFTMMTMAYLLGWFRGHDENYVSGLRSFYLAGIRELSGKIENEDILRLLYKYVKAGWEEDTKSRTMTA